MQYPASISSRARKMPPGCACEPCKTGQCDRHSPGARRYYEGLREAMDSAPPDRDDPEERNRRVASESEETAGRRQQSGNDRATKLRFLERGERLLKDAVDRQEATQKKARDARAAASWERCKTNVEQYKKRKAADDRHKAAARERALDRAIEQEELRAQRHDKQVNDSYSASLRAMRDRMLGKAKDAEPDLDIQVAEELPAMVDIDGAMAAKREFDAAGERLRSRYARKSPAMGTAPVARHVSSLEDIDGDYAAAGRRLRGQDTALTPDAKLQAEHRLARQKLESR